MAALPLNREERYYSAHLLTGIISCRNLAHVGLFLNRCRATSRAKPPSTSVRLIAEYNTLKSLTHRSVAHLFPDHPKSHCGIDLLIHLTDPRPILVFVEAKMFDLALDLESVQMPTQRAWLEHLGDFLGAQPGYRHHVALLPGGIARVAADEPYKVVLWEEVLSDYRELAPPHLIVDLDAACHGYKTLASRGWRSGLRTPGREIYRTFHAGTPGGIRWVGRGALRGRGGLTGIDGTGFAADLSTGEWARFKYSISDAPSPPNERWFSVADFVSRIDQSLVVTELGAGKAPHVVAASLRVKFPELKIKETTLAIVAELLATTRSS